ncbi:MAG: NUDIX domain-containing protein [Dehalococcoidia bacterium]|nr:NUDIX domain-containing protein [Dehalococcoidia bacterium]
MSDQVLPFTPRVAAVLTRSAPAGLEVLVFEHPDVDGSGVSLQLPAGTVEAGEDAGEAAERELLEETGVMGAEVRALLGVLDEPAAEGESLPRRRWVFHLEATLPPPERWTSTCDCGASLDCHWLPLASAELHPAQQPWLELARAALGGAP